MYSIFESLQKDRHFGNCLHIHKCRELTSQEVSQKPAIKFPADLLKSAVIRCEKTCLSVFPAQKVKDCSMTHFIETDSLQAP